MSVRELIEALVPYADDAEVRVFVPEARLRWGTYGILSITPYTEAKRTAVINLNPKEV